MIQQSRSKLLKPIDLIIFEVYKVYKCNYYKSFRLHWLGSLYTSIAYVVYVNNQGVTQEKEINVMEIITYNSKEVKVVANELHKFRSSTREHWKRVNL